MLGIVFFVGAVGAQSPLLPTNNDPTNQIRFQTASQADAKRDQLIDWIWSGGLPTSTLPSVVSNISFPTDLNGINRSLVAQVDKLDANVSGMDFHTTSYLIRPNNAVHSNQLAIVHQGHAFYEENMNYGIATTANRLLQAGYSVIAMQMPMYGWNTDTTVTLPGGGTVTMSNTDGGYHNSLFNQLEPVLGGGAMFRFFLEPVVQSVNYFKMATPGAGDVSMMGLSGGGWTTNLAAAVDTRIKLSVPVAGTAPLYVRNADPKSYGDAEQKYTPLYDENIAPDGSGGGIATWQEIYALGGYGDGRRQIMVTNRDDYYFGGTWPYDFSDIITSLVANNLEKGQWGYAMDLTQNPAVPHQIFPWTLENVIMPAMPIPEPSVVLLAMTGLLALGLHVCRKRWSHRFWMCPEGR